VSEYPTQYSNVNLNTIKYLQKHYSGYSIGYSDHTIGISTPVAAVAMGAKIIEKHITLDRKMKGTDQAGSLGIDGIRRMVRDIRNLEQSFGKEDIFIENAVMGAKNKLERSIATRARLVKGQVINIDDIHLLSPGDGYKWSEKNKVIGKTVKVYLEKDEIIYPHVIK
jgi:sialic acid synthase